MVNKYFHFKIYYCSSCCGTVETNPTKNREAAGSIPGLAQWVKDLALLWLCCRPAATNPIQPLAWKLPYVTGSALKKKKQENTLPDHLYLANLMSVSRPAQMQLISMKPSLILQGKNFPSSEL